MKKIAEAYEGEELELIDSYIEDNPPKDKMEAIWYLSKSLEKLSGADVFIGIQHDWDWAGCNTESTVAARYGMKVYSVEPAVVIDNYQELVNRAFIKCDREARK